MTGLVSPAPIADPAQASVAADDWYPAITLASIRERYRLGEGVTTTLRLTHAIEGAMLSAMRELEDWRTAREAAGVAEIEDVTDRQLNSRNLAVVLWERIIGNLAAAELSDLHRDVSATNDGLDRAEERGMTADDYRRIAMAAINDLRSIGGDPVSRMKVSLI
jgi:hypothetical protein